MTVQPRRILWPTDFSPQSQKGGRYASAFRTAFAAELHIIHVIPPPMAPDTAMALGADAPMTVAEPNLVESCLDGLRRVVAEQFSGDATIKIDAFYGNPWSGICDYARSHDIDLIVLSTHGRTGLRHVFLGSTAECVMRHAPCPVLTVKMDEKDFLVE